MKDVIIAMDFPSKDKADEFLINFEGQKLFLKIGMELFYKEGPQIVRDYKKSGHKIFLDLKLHDIPNTVKSATQSLIDLNVDMINFHILGGYNMLFGANEVIKKENKNIIALGVTMLTSTDENIMHDEIKIDGNLPLNEVILQYAYLAKKAGLQGIVCSALEVPRIKKHLGDDFLTATPGIRPEFFKGDDQKRVVTPKYARELGSDYIVVGRPITRATNPLQAYREIKKDFLGE